MGEPFVRGMESVKREVRFGFVGMGILMADASISAPANGNGVLVGLAVDHHGVASAGVAGNSAVGE